MAYLGLAAMALSRHAPLAVFCLLAFLAGTATALFAPAVSGVMPLIVPGDQLEQSNGIQRAGTNLAMLFGLALSGTVVAVAGAGWALLIDAVSFVISAALTAGLKSQRPAESPLERVG